ncbi:MAG TPA: hypothetical protein VK856_07645 [Anaerolineaceae bacterium]|nr:hypothetical protein [Anaerolineaceae bacterium]
MSNLWCEYVYDVDLASEDEHVLRSRVDVDENATHWEHHHHDDRDDRHRGDVDDHEALLHGCDDVDVVPSSTKPSRQ